MNTQNTIALEWAKSQSRIIDVLEQALPRPCYGYFERVQKRQAEELAALANSIHAFLGIAA